MKFKLLIILILVSSSMLVFFIKPICTEIVTQGPYCAADMFGQMPLSVLDDMSEFTAILSNTTVVTLFVMMAVVVVSKIILRKNKYFKFNNKINKLFIPLHFLISRGILARKNSPNLLNYRFINN